MPDEMRDGLNRSGMAGLAPFYGRFTNSRFFEPLIIVSVTALLLCVSLIIKPELMISFDQLKYLTIAKNLAEGNGAHDIYDAPGSFTSFRIGYTALLVAMIRVAGISDWLVAALNYSIFFALVVSVCLLGVRLFGRFGGVIGTLFFIMIPETLIFGVRNLDALWPVLIIVSLLLLLSQPKGRRRDVAYGLSAGLAACYAIFVKETSILFIPVPAVLLLLGAKPVNIRRTLSFYAGAAILSLFWVGYALLILNLSPQFLWTGADVSDIPQIGNAKSYVSFLAGGLAGYFNNSAGKGGAFVLARLPLVGMMILALGWSLWKALKGDISHRVLLVALAAFLPLSAMAGALNMRFSQNFLLLIFFCLLLGTAVVAMIETLKIRFPGHFSKSRIAIALLIAGACLLFGLRNTSYAKSVIGRLALTSKDSRIQVVYNGHNNVKALNGLPAGPVIAGDCLGELNRSVFLFGKGRVAVPLTLFRYVPGVTVPVGTGAVVTCVFKDPAMDGETIFLFDAETFIKQLKDSKAKYVALPGGMAAVAGWIEENVGAEKSLAFPRRNEPPDILLVLPENIKPQAPQGQAHKIFISGATVDFLSALKKDNPSEHSKYVDSLFRLELRFEDQAVAEILEGKTQGLRHILIRPQQF
jgi:hypothetical protein